MGGAGASVAFVGAFGERFVEACRRLIANNNTGPAFVIFGLDGFVWARAKCRDMGEVVFGIEGEVENWRYRSVKIVFETGEDGDDLQVF